MGLNLMKKVSQKFHRTADMCVTNDEVYKIVEIVRRNGHTTVNRRRSKLCIDESSYIVLLPKTNQVDTTSSSPTKSL